MHFFAFLGKTLQGLQGCLDGLEAGSSFGKNFRTMAKQVGPQYVTGTIGDLTFYKLFEKYYVRTKSSLNRDRIKRDKAFERFRRCSSEFGRASALASVLYWSLPLEMRGHGVQGRLTGEFYQLLLSEVGVDRAVEVMVERYLGRREKEGSRAEAQGTQRGDLTPSRQGAKDRQEDGEAKVVVGAVERRGVQGNLRKKPKVFRVLERCRDRGKMGSRQVGVPWGRQLTGVDLYSDRRRGKDPETSSGGQSIENYRLLPLL